MVKWIVIFLSFVCVGFAGENFCKIEFSNGAAIENLPIADNEKMRQKGLSKKVDVGNGMLFSWDTPQYVHFWMKNTLVPLSIGFFDKNHKLFQIENMEPLSLELHSSMEKAVFALELKKDEFQKQNITIGTKIIKLKCDQ